MNVIEIKNFILIFIVFFAACIETDIYLPAFVDMMHYFSTTEEAIQSLLTWNFLGMCLSGPLYGPISDAMGRKKPLLVALSLFFIGSLLTVFAMRFDHMLWGRLLQGLGSGGCFTLGTAILFDVYQDKKAIFAVSKMNAIVPFLLALAPIVGGYLNQLYSWRANFVLIALIVFLCLLICLFFFDESLAKEKRKALCLKTIGSNFSQALTSPPFWQLTMIVSLLLGGYLAFLSGISVLYVMSFGVSKALLPFFQAALSSAWLIASLTSRTSINRWGVDKVKLSGTACVVAGSIGLLITALLSPKNPYLHSAVMMFFVFGVNWAQGLYFPESMEILPEIKGVTASLLTSTRLLVAALIVGLASMCYNATIFPLVAVIMLVMISVVITIIFYEKRRQLINEQ